MTLSMHHGIQTQAFVRQHLLDNVPVQHPAGIIKLVLLRYGEQRRPYKLGPLNLSRFR